MEDYSAVAHWLVLFLKLKLSVFDLQLIRKVFAEVLNEGRRGVGFYTIEI